MSVSWKIASTMVLPLALALSGVGCVAEVDEAAADQDFASVDEAEQTSAASQAFGFGGCHGGGRGCGGHGCGGFSGGYPWFPGGYFGCGGHSHCFGRGFPWGWGRRGPRGPWF